MQQVCSTGRLGKGGEYDLKTFVEYILLLFTAAVMAVCTAQDVRKKKISANYVFLFIACNLFLAMMNKNGWKDMLTGMVPGISLFGISMVTRGKIGQGDALIVTGAGIYLGIWMTLLMFFCSLVLSCLYGGYLLKKKRGWSCQMAFLPFLFVPYGGILMLRICGGI